MGIHEGVLRKGEMEEKLKLLNQNIQFLTAEELPDEENEGEGEDKQESKDRSRRSVEVIRNLEDQLGLQISDKHKRVMNYKDKLHMSKDELLKSQEQAEQFVAKMKEKQKELRVQRKAQRDKERYKTKTVLDQSLEKQKQILEERKQKVLERIEEHKGYLENQKEQRSVRERNWKNFKNKEKTSKYLHEEIEERYNKDILMPELEKKKRELENLRKLHKPIKKEDLDEHEKNYQEKIKIEREKQRMKREKWYSDIGYGVFDENRYKTKFYEKALEEERAKGSNKGVEEELKKKKQEKMNSYAKIVKEMHWPEISENKRKEIEELKNNMENSNKPQFKYGYLKSRVGANTSESPDREGLI